MAVHRRQDARLDLGLRRRRAGKALEEHLRLVDEARRAVAALEREVVEEGGLHRRELAVAAGALDGADRFVGKKINRGDAAMDRARGAVRMVDDDDAGAAGADAAAELGAGQVEIFAQIVVHREPFRDLVRADRGAVHPHADRHDLHRSAALMVSAVTGSASKRLPIASAMALRIAGGTGMLTSSAMPFGTSVGPSGGSTSMSSFQTGRSEARGTR